MANRRAVAPPEEVPDGEDEVEGVAPAGDEAEPWPAAAPDPLDPVEMPGAVPVALPAALAPEPRSRPTAGDVPWVARLRTEPVEGTETDGRGVGGIVTDGVVTDGTVPEGVDPTGVLTDGTLRPGVTVPAGNVAALPDSG